MNDAPDRPRPVIEHFFGARVWAALGVAKEVVLVLVAVSSTAGFLALVVRLELIQGFFALVVALFWVFLALDALEEGRLVPWCRRLLGRGA